jgi:hypothetical protein
MIQAVYSFLSSLDPEVKGAIIGALTTVIAGGLGLLVLVWRLRREAQLAIDENKTTEAMKLKLKIYEQEVIKVVEVAVDTEVAFAGFIRRFISDLRNHKTLADAGLPSSLPVARIPALIELKGSFDRAAIALITFTERWFVIDPRFEVFRIAINAALYDIGTEYAAYFDFVLRAMPVDLPGGVHWTAPSNDQIDAMNAASDKLIDRLGTMTAYSSDFQAEMQNVLIGPLFGNAVPRRQPLDPRHVVISLANDALLTQYFQEDTPWGRNRKAIEDNVRARFDGQT